MLLQDLSPRVLVGQLAHLRRAADLTLARRHARPAVAAVADALNRGWVVKSHLFEHLQRALGAGRACTEDADGQPEVPFQLRPDTSRLGVTGDVARLPD